MMTHHSSPQAATKAASSRRVLAYHEIFDGPTQDVYQITPERFLAHIAAATQTARKHRVELEVTFDDGHASHVSNAGPLLESVGLRGIFFIPAANIGIGGSTASWPDLRALQAKGHGIGSHGNTHILLTGCSDRKLREELVRSRLTLEDKLGVPVLTISMPGGRWDARVAAACKEAGYKQLYSSQPGAALPTSHVGFAEFTVSGRLAVLRRTRIKTLRHYIAGDPIQCASLIAQFHLRSAVKHLVGDRVYGAVWRHAVRTTPTT